MKCAVVLYLSLLMADGFASQDLPTGVIEGTVVNEMTGEPVRHAGVVLSLSAGGASPPELVTTGSDGRFRFEGLAPGTGNLTARKTGYLDHGRMIPVQLKAGEEKVEVTIKLAPQGIIAGRVTDNDGDPLQAVHVEVSVRTKFAGRQRWQHVTDASSDDRGEYRLTNLGPGEYIVSASYSDPISKINATTKSRAEVYATTYFPNALDANSAQAVTVQSGAETGGIDIRLRRDLAYRIRVRVDGASPNAQRQTGVELMQWDANGNLSNVAVGASEVEPGVFELVGVRAGSWLVQARAYGGGAEPSVGITPLQITNADQMEVVVPVGPPPQLRGAFLFEGQRAAKVEWKRYGVSLINAEGGRSSGAGQFAVTEDGTFALPYWPPGKYIVSSRSPSSDMAYLASVRVGNEERLGKEIDLTAGPPGPVRVTFRNDMAKVKGRVEGDLEGASDKLGTVVLVPKEEHLRKVEYMFATGVGPGGSFEFGRVRPGEYLLCHIAGDLKTYYENGVPPKASLEAATRLTVESSGTHTVVVKAAKVAAPQPERN